MSCRIHRRLEDILPHVETVSKGEYRGYTVVLIGGSSYRPSHFESYPEAESSEFFGAFRDRREAPYAEIRFQTRLSGHTATFAFDRPTDLLNHRLYDAGSGLRHVYVPTRTDLTVRRYALFMARLFRRHAVRPPYVLVGFSEGGFDALCFAKHFPMLTRAVCFVDSLVLGRLWREFETFRGNDQWYRDLAAGRFSFDHRRVPATCDGADRETLERLDTYIFERKTVDVILKLGVRDIPRSVPMLQLWSPYQDDPRVPDERKVDIQRRQSRLYPANIRSRWLDAPHQMERVIPLTLATLVVQMGDSAAV
jgi:pimeloyl-ACP methyl ester carboxylesterase